MNVTPIEYVTCYLITMLKLDNVLIVATANGFKVPVCISVTPLRGEAVHSGFEKENVMNPSPASIHSSPSPHPS